jgi:hypothetical protein
MSEMWFASGFGGLTYRARISSRAVLSGVLGLSGGSLGHMVSSEGRDLQRNFVDGYENT